MRKRVLFSIIIFITISIANVYISYVRYVSFQEKNEIINSKLTKAEDNLAACVKAVVGVESDFDPLYHSV
jgi:hypothetical protein